MEAARNRLRFVVTEAEYLKDYGNTAIIVEVLEYILDKLEEAGAK